MSWNTTGSHFCWQRCKLNLVMSIHNAPLSWWVYLGKSPEIWQKINLLRHFLCWIFHSCHPKITESQNQVGKTLWGHQVQPFSSAFNIRSWKLLKQSQNSQPGASCGGNLWFCRVSLEFSSRNSLISCKFCCLRGVFSIKDLHTSPYINRI